MLSSITPLGERARNRTWATTVTAYVAGSTTGGAFMGFVFGWTASLIPAAAQPSPLTGALVLAAALGGAALFELGFGGVAVPAIKRQVNEDWLDEFRGWVVGGGFGLQLGAGLTTIVTSASVYVVWLAAALTLSPLGGAIVGATFGFVRALPLLATRKVTTPAALRSWHAAMGRLARPMRRLTATMCLGLGATLAAAGAGGLVV